MSEKNEKSHEVNEDVKEKCLVSANDDIDDKKVNSDENNDNSFNKKRSVWVFVAIAATIIVVILVIIISKIWKKEDETADDKELINYPIITLQPREDDESKNDDMIDVEYREKLELGTTLEPEEMNKTSIKIDESMLDDNYIYKLEENTNYSVDLNGDGEKEDICYYDYSQFYPSLVEGIDISFTINYVYLYLDGVLVLNLDNYDEIYGFYIADIDNSDGCFDFCFEVGRLIGEEEKEYYTVYLPGKDVKNVSDVDFDYEELRYSLETFNMLISTEAKLNYDGIPGNTQQINTGSADL